jgi:hypothetical protein
MEKTGSWLASRLLYPSTTKTKIGFPGWPEPNLDWDSGFGGSVQEEGGLHQPPFSFLGGYFKLPAGESLSFACNTQDCCPAPVLGPRKFKAHAEVAICCMLALRSSRTARKKVSGQWGDRPLGRAMEPWSEVSSTLLYPAQGGEQAVPLRSRAAVRRTGADTR